MTHPPGYRFRAPTKDDLEGVTAVLIAEAAGSATRSFAGHSRRPRNTACGPCS